MSDRRQQLAEAATDYALEHGLLGPGLSLRPLAAKIGTSDRMLLYHFADKDDLVAHVIRIATARSCAALAALPPSADPGAAVRDLWATASAEPIRSCARLYAEASALGVLGREPYVSLVKESNDAWMDVLSGHLATSGVAADQAPRLAGLVDAAFLGMTLDLPLDDDPAVREIVDGLAEAVGVLAGGSVVPS